MHGIRKVARAYYERASAEEKYSAEQFFESLAVDGDGKVSLSEFMEFADSWYSDENFFKQLDANGDGTLDFREVLSLYYIEKLNRTFPACCVKKTPHVHLTCVVLATNEGKSNTSTHCPTSSITTLFKLFRKCTIDAQKTQEEKGMDELRKIAKSHYRAGSPEVQALAHDFFNSLDIDGDGKVDLPEFLTFMRQEGYAHMRNPHFFKS